MQIPQVASVEEFVRWEERLTYFGEATLNGA